MARLELVHAGAAAPPAPSLVVAAGDVAASGDGLLRLLDGRCFALEVAQEGQLRVRLGEPWAALCALPHAAGLLASARGSRRLLFCPHPASLAAGQAADAFLLGEHDAPITALATSRSGALVLSADAAGALALWSLEDGARLAAAPGGGGCSAAIAACFLPGDVVAVAHTGSTAVQLWSTASPAGAPALALHGELDTAGSGSGGRHATALASAGPLLAVGCSDGSTQVWRCDGREWSPQAELPAPHALSASAPAVSSLCFSQDAALLAAAAGTAVSVGCCSTGQLLAVQSLPGPPVSLRWGSGGQLSALLPDVSQLQLGAPEPAAPQSAQAASGTEPALQRKKKVVRFAEQPSEPAPAALELRVPLHSAAAAAAAAAATSSRSAVPTGSLGAGGSAGLPPLPSHPLLRYGAACTIDISSQGSGTGTGVAAAAPSTGEAAPSPRGRREPLYPILDLRAMQGLNSQPTAAAAGTAPPEQRSCQPRPPASGGGAAVRVAAAELSTTRSMHHVGTSTEPSCPDPCSQQPAVCSLSTAAGSGAPAVAPAAKEQPPADAQGEDEQPRLPRLPSPTQRQRSPFPHQPAPRVSKQQCETCVVLHGAASASSRPASPAKAALLAQLAELSTSQPAGASAGGSSGSRPASPLKVGVACTQEAQEQAGEPQPAEVRPFTVVQQYDASLAHSQFRQQRYARLSRRCAPGKPPAPGSAPSAQAATAEPELAAAEAAAPLDVAAPPVEQEAGALADGHIAEGEHSHNEAAQAAAAPADLEKPAADGEACSPSPAAPNCDPPELGAAAAMEPDAFAVDSDAELLSEGEEEAALPLTNAALPAARGGSCASSLSNAAGVQPRPVQLPLCVQPAATSSGGCLPAVEPASRLAAPVPHSSLLLAHRREQLERQAAAAAQAPLPAEQLAAVRRAAATAATTLPLDARVFTGLPPQQQEEEESDGAGSGLSPSKRAALAAERKRLDARWVAEQRELQPPRGALWEALEARQQPGLAPLPPLAVPLPDGRQLAAAFLGLQGL